MLSWRLFILQLSSFLKRPDHIITLRGCRALVSAASLVEWYAVGRCTFSVSLLSSAQDCPSVHTARHGGFPEFTRFAARAYAASGAIINAKVFPAKMVPPVVVALITMILLIFAVVVAKLNALANVP